VLMKNSTKAENLKSAYAKPTERNHSSDVNTSCRATQLTEIIIPQNLGLFSIDCIFNILLSGVQIVECRNACTLRIPFFDSSFTKLLFYTGRYIVFIHLRRQ
jgi:hypothetical protein